MIGGAVEGGPKLKAAENEFAAHPGSADESLIRIRAYERWEARGRPDGSDQEDWFTAEEEMRR
jgi:hypothetical protein